MYFLLGDGCGHHSGESFRIWLRSLSRLAKPNHRWQLGQNDPACVQMQKKTFFYKSQQVMMRARFEQACSLRHEDESK